MGEESRKERRKDLREQERVVNTSLDVYQLVLGVEERLWYFQQHPADNMDVK